LLFVLWMVTLCVVPPAFAAPPPPPPEYDVEIKSDAAVFVDETLPTTNYNGGSEGTYLRVGSVPEFCGDWWSLIRFDSITESDGGPLPDDADLTDARIKIYKQSGVAGTVAVYILRGHFNEGTVSWNTRPSVMGGSSPQAISTEYISGASGWHYIDIPNYVVEDWISLPGLNYGVVLAPGWTACGDGMAFRSDEALTLEPTLVLSYTAEEPPPTPAPTATPVPDLTPCVVSYTLTPPSPGDGDTVTITARATDNLGLMYVSIERGMVELARRNATSLDQTELEVSYTQVASMPVLRFTIVADDIGDALPQRLDINVPVGGTGTRPVVSVEAEFEIREVIPERYQLITGDGQTVTVTATASDPDGIEYLSLFVNGVAHDFAYTGETSVSETVTWVNDEPSRTRFYYSAAARDREGFYVTADGASYDIAHLEDLRLMWVAAPGFNNPSRDRLPWTRMEQTFGSSEVWWVKSWGWKSPHALIAYHARFKNAADGGECFGMSTLAAEIFHGRISSTDLESGLMASELSYSNSFTREYVECRQGGQLGDEVFVSRVDQAVEWVAEATRHLRKLGYIEDDLERDDPGVIGIYEDDHGHALTPWMTRLMPDGTTRVYVYDCNYASDTGLDGIHNPAADFTYFCHFPYMEFDLSGWSYAFGYDCSAGAPTDIWNDDLFYFDYEDACGDLGQYNSLGSGGPRITDQDLPGFTDLLVGVFGGEADVYFEDDDGRVTGMYEGELREEIPGSMAVIPMMGGAFTEHEMYVLPIDQRLSAHVVGQEDGDYILGLTGGYSVYSVEDKSLSAGVEDIVVIEPLVEAVGHRVTVEPGEADDDFTVRVAHMFEGTVEALGTDFVGREYIMEGVTALAGSRFSIHVEEGGDTVIIESSAEYADPEEELGYVPSSSEDDISLGGGETLEATPEDWATTEQKGSMHTLGGTREKEPAPTEDAAAEDSAGGFPVVPVVAGVLGASALILAALLRMGVFRRGAEA